MQLRKPTNSEIELFILTDDLNAFDGVRADLDAEAGQDGWAHVPFAEARQTLTGGAAPDGAQVILAVDSRDEARAAELGGLVGQIRASGLGVVLLAKDITPVAMHALLRAGVDDLVPYPAPDGALSETLDRVRMGRTAGGQAQGAGPKKRGVILPVYGVAGGVGATTFAVNLAWELAQAIRKEGKRVCLLDLDFQYGSASTYLDLPRHEAIYELLSDSAAMDHSSLANALTSFNKRMAVLTAPMDALPLDVIGPEDVEKLLDVARGSYDYVVIDLPKTLTLWTEAVLRQSETFFVLMETDMRSAQNMLRFLRTLKAEELPLEKIEVAINRAPKFTDMSGRNRVKRMAESLGVEFRILLPEGGKAVVAACDHGAPLAEQAKSNALRKEIKRVAASIQEQVDAAAAAIA